MKNVLLLFFLIAYSCESIIEDPLIASFPVSGTIRLVTPEDENDNPYQISLDNDSLGNLLGFGRSEDLAWLMTVDHEFDESQFMETDLVPGGECNNYSLHPYEIHWASERVPFLMFELSDALKHCERIYPVDSNLVFSFLVWIKE